MQRVKAFETGTIRFGMFGSARLYAGAGLVADVLERYPGVRVEIIGQNSSEVLEDLRRGRIEAALIAAPPTSEGLAVTPVVREELVYVSADPSRTANPVTARRLAEASLVMADTTYRATDSTRLTLRKMLHEAGHNPQTRIEVEDVETAIELMGRGLADTVVPQGAARELVPRLAPGATWTPLRPRQYETFAIVHRVNAILSPAAGLMIELAVRRMRRSPSRSAGRPIVAIGAVSERPNDRASTGRRRHDTLDQVGLEGSVDAVVARVVGGVAVAVACDEDARVELGSQRLRLDQRRRRVAGGADHHDRRRTVSVDRQRLGVEPAGRWPVATGDQPPREHPSERRRRLIEGGVLGAAPPTA